MKKRILSLLLAGTLSLALMAGCSNPAGEPSASPGTTPTVTPSVTPSTTTPALSVVDQVWDQIATDLSDVLPAAMDLTGDDLKTTYGIDPADLTDYICKVPMMSATITEFFLAEVADGKMDTVKALVQARQEALADGFLYPSMVALVDDYQLVVNGNYILFCITEDADTAVEIFDGYTK